MISFLLFIFPVCLQCAGSCSSFWEYSNEQKHKNTCPHASYTLVGERRQKWTLKKNSNICDTLDNKAYRKKFRQIGSCPSYSLLCTELLQNVVAQNSNLFILLICCLDWEIRQVTIAVDCLCFIVSGAWNHVKPSLSSVWHLG